MVDYPLIAYNSFVPDNSEIILTSLAEHIKKSQVINLGPKIRFIAFINSPFLLDDIWNSNVKDWHCIIYFLAWHVDKKRI